MQVVDQCTATQIEQILACAPVAGTPPLPVRDMRQIVLDRDPLAQVRPARSVGARNSARRCSSGWMETLRTGGGVVPVLIQRRFQAAAGYHRRTGLARHGRQLPPLLTCHHADQFAQGVAQQIVRIFDPARPHNGLLSSAARSARGLNPPWVRATSTLRSSSRRSPSWAISR